MLPIFERIVRSVALRNWCYRQATNILVRPAVTLIHPTIIAVTGTNGKTTVCRLLDRVFRDAGYNVGCATTDGVWLNGERIADGDNAGGNGLWRIVRRARPDLILAETSRGGILRHGIAFRHCAVAVVLNVSEDHLGDGGVETVDDMARLKSRLLDHAACAVLNWDDGRVRAMSGRVAGRVLPYTIRGCESQFDNGFFVRDGAYMKRAAHGEEFLARVEEARLSCGGLLEHQVENVLAAIATVDAMQGRFSVSLDSLRRSLSNYGGDMKDQAGRNNLLRYSTYSVLLLRSKNPAGMRCSAATVRIVADRLRPKRIIGLLTDVAGAKSEQLQTVAQIAAETCDLVAVGPPHERYWRNMPPAELSSHLASGIPPQKLISDGTRSLDELIRSIGDEAGGDLFVVFNAMDDPRVDLEQMLAKGEMLSIATGRSSLNDASPRS